MNIATYFNKNNGLSLFFWPDSIFQEAIFFNKRFQGSLNFYNYLIFIVILTFITREPYREPLGNHREPLGKVGAAGGKVPYYTTARFIKEMYINRWVKGIGNLEKGWVGTGIRQILAFLILKNYILCSLKKRIREGLFFKLFKELSLTLSPVSIVSISLCSGSKANSIPSFPIALYRKSRNITLYRSNEINKLALLRSMKDAITGRLNDLLIVLRVIFIPHPPIKIWSQIRSNLNLYPAINWITFPGGLLTGDHVHPIYCVKSFFSAHLADLKTGGAGGVHV